MKRVLIHDRTSTCSTLAKATTAILVIFAVVPHSRQLNAQGYTDTIARTGEAVPDGNGNYLDFRTVQINNSGEVAFLAGLSGTSGGEIDNSGIFRHRGSATIQIAREGQAAPGNNGTYSFFGDDITIPIQFNHSGQVAFYATLTGTGGGFNDDSGIFRGSGGTITQIVREGQVAPDGNGTYSVFGNSRINNAGQVAYLATLIGTTGGTSDNRGIFRGSGGDIVQIAREGQVAPDGNGTYSAFESPQFNNLGQVAFMASLSGTSGGFFDNTGIYRGSGGSIIQIAREGQAAPDANGTYVSFNNPMLNDSGQTAFQASLTGTNGGVNDNSGIFRGSGGTITQIVREGQVAPDANGAYSTFIGDLSFNAQGQVAFLASLTGTSGGGLDDRGIFRGSGGAIVQIAREGQLAPDGNGTFESIGRGPMNNSGQVAFLVTLTGTNGGSADNRGIFTGNGTEMLQVARNGQALAGSTIINLGDLSLNDFGQIAYRADLANGGEVVRRWTPDLHWRGGTGSWDNSTNWTLGLDPALVHRTFIDSSSGGAVLGPGSDTHVQQLVVGGAAVSMLVLQQGVTLEIDNGLGVTPNGILAGTGSIDGDVSVRGTLRPSTGPQGIGSMRIGGNLELVGSSLLIDISGAEFGEFDFLSIGGDMFVGGQLLVDVDPLFHLGPNMEFLFANIQGNRFFEFDGLADLSLVGNFGGRDLFITYNAGDGNDIALFTSVPEPSVFVVAGIAIGVFLSLRRKPVNENSQLALYEDISLSRSLNVRM